MPNPVSQEAARLAVGHVGAMVVVGRPHRVGGHAQGGGVGVLGLSRGDRLHCLGGVGLGRGRGVVLDQLGLVCLAAGRRGFRPLRPGRLDLR